MQGILQAPKPLGNPRWQDHAPGSRLLLKCPSQKGWGSPLKLSFIRPKGFAEMKPRGK